VAASLDKGELMVKRFVLLLAMFAVAFVIWSAPVTATPSPEAAARAAIDAGNRRYLDALIAGDAEGFSALYEIDGIQMPSASSPIVRGRAAIKAQTAADLKAITYLHGDIKTTNLAVFGTVAYETGTYSFTYRQKGKQTATISGRYFVVWDRQADGSYLIKVDSGFPPACAH
jgi:uncharacterized protein (TIGR02246 family)